MVRRHNQVQPKPLPSTARTRIPPRIRRLVAGSRLVVFEHSGHSPNVEERERFADVVAPFLAEAPA